ncbi:MAG: DUF1385 domain-containing protein [Clostridia bacterium]|nr:DUF1385 domain-containing protein [Clostridia bacterium]
MKKKCEGTDCRLGKVGGQAVLEGVMMKAGNRTVTTCRKDDGTLVVTDDSFVSVRKKHKILNIPILRGIISFVESLILSVKTLGASAEALGLEEEENPGKFELWLKNKLGVKITDVIMVIATVLGVALSVFLFICLPGWLSYGLDALLNFFFNVRLGAFTAVVEGVVKVGIFLAYLSLVSLMPDIKRTFMYHGAEHKSIACFEAGEELTPENARKHTRFHPRCGTSFMFFMILIGIIAGLFIKLLIPGLDMWAYTLIRLLILPLLVGLGFEVIMLAGKHVNPVTKAISAPGLWVQRITTKEPTDDMLEVAITSIKCALRDDFPEFSEFFEARGWEKKPDGGADAAVGESSLEVGESTVIEDAEAFGEETITSAEQSANIPESTEPQAQITDTAAPAENTEAKEPSAINTATEDIPEAVEPQTKDNGNDA